MAARRRSHWDDSLPCGGARGPWQPGVWRPGRALRVAVLVPAEATYAAVASRSPMGKRGPETGRTPAGAAVVLPEGVSR